MRRLIITLAMLLTHAVAAPAQPRPAAGRAASLVGTWRLVVFEDVKDGRKIYRYGEKPSGIFIYTADGHVAIQIANPANPVCVASVEKEETKVPVCNPEQMQKLLDGYVAYWGTYTVDAEAGVVVHHVQGDLRNGYGGTDQRRPFRLDGDRLIIGDGKTWTRVLVRVH